MVLLGASSSYQAHAIIKCQDADGNWHMGDTLPQECVKEGHQELNEQGFVIEEVDRQKTDAEIAEEKEQAKVEAEKQAEAAEQAKQDQILMDTFSSVDDINSAREGKLAAINASIGLAEKRNEKLQKDLDNLEKAAAEQERSGNAPSEKTIEEIESLRRQVEVNNKFIADKMTEKEQVNAEYDQNIARFEELKSKE